MASTENTVVELERKFWQSMVDQDTDTALSLLCEPALMVSPHGAMQFDHAGYRKMAEQGTMLVKSFEFSDMTALLPNDATAVLTYRVKQEVASREAGKKITQQMINSSTWVRDGDRWLCALHTETSAAEKPAATG